MASITYYALSTYFINQLKNICGNVSDEGGGYTPILIGTGTGTQQNSSTFTYNLTNVASGTSTSTLTLYSLKNDSSIHYGAPAPISTSEVRAIMKSEFSKLGIDIDSGTTRSPKEATHFINAAILFLAYHLYAINPVNGATDPVYAFNNGKQRAIVFNSERQSNLMGIGVPILTKTKQIEDRDLLIETFNSLISLAPTNATRMGGLDIRGFSVTCSSSSSSCSSSCSSCSNSCSSSSIFIAYFNI